MEEKLFTAYKLKLEEMYNKLHEITRDCDNKLFLNDDLLNAESHIYSAICDFKQVLK